jgi:hypothetical protein
MDLALKPMSLTSRQKNKENGGVDFIDIFLNEITR